MSEENVEILRRVFEEASHGDPAAVDALDPDTIAVILKNLHPKVEFHEDPRFPEAGVYRGIEQVRDYLGSFTESFDRFTYEIEDYVDIGGKQVLVLLRLTTRGRGSGATVEVRPGWICTIRDGLTVRVDAILDRDDALRAAGLSE